MRSDRRHAVALSLLVVVAARAVGAATPTVVVIKSSAIPPFELATAAILDTLTHDPLQPEVLTFSLEGEAGLAETVLATARRAHPTLVVTVGSLATSTTLRDTGLRVPLVFSMVLYPGQSGFLANSGRAVTGASLDVPLDTQFDYLHRLLPGARTVGVLYSASETGTVVEAARKAAPAHGLSLVARAVDDPGTAVAALAELMERVDVVWSVADSHVFTPQSTSALILASLRRRIPMLGLSAAHVRAGTLAALSCDYADVGRQTGDIVLRALHGEPPESIPISSPRKVTLALNLRTAKHLDVSIPPALEAEATDVVR
jgi:putative ABC transport system substrate-binding protein